MKKKLKLNKLTLRRIGGATRETWPGEPTSGQCPPGPIVRTYTSCPEQYATYENPSCYVQCSGDSCCSCPGTGC